MKRDGTKNGFGVIGIGAAACTACCAGPILVVLAGTGLFTIAGVVTFGLAGFVILVPAGLWWNRRSRARSRAAAVLHR